MILGSVLWGAGEADAARDVVAPLLSVLESLEGPEQIAQLGEADLNSGDREAAISALGRAQMAGFSQASFLGWTSSPWASLADDPDVQAILADMVR